MHGHQRPDTTAGCLVVDAIAATLAAPLQEILHLGGILVEAHRVDVEEYRPRPGPGDSPAGRKESVGTGDDFIAAADVERHQRDQQRIGAGRDADAELALDIGRDLVFQRLAPQARG